MEDYQEAREKMVTWQIERRGVFDERVLEAMRSVPRHQFVPTRLASEAYSDYPLPIGYEQTISQPYIVALMTSLLDLKPDGKVLEIGTGSGYQTAILCTLAGHVTSLEIIPALAENARQTLKDCDIQNMEIHCQDGSGGYPENAPYDGILVAACAPRVPDVLVAQLREGGKLVIPVGDRWQQILQVWTKDQTGEITESDHIPVAFVPLRGKWGFKS